MVLSTCNRSEIYFFSQGESGFEQAKQCYIELFPEAEVEPYLQEKHGKTAMEYLFRVAAGLESLVLGEDQILGQVGDAIDFSRTMGFAGKELNKIVRDAVTLAKQIKTTLKISEQPLSVSYVGIRELKKACPLEQKRILVIGSGKTAALALTYIMESNPERVYVCSRNRVHAEQLRKKFPQIQIREYEERYDRMCDCPVVVSATSSPHLVVRREEVQRVLEKRKQSHSDVSLVFLDLATPRDVDESLEKISGLRIINMDTLQRICDRNQKQREELAAQCDAIIAEAVQASADWLKISRMDDTIESLQKRCAEIVEDSYSYLNKKLALENREQKIVKKVLNASLQRLLKEPIQELKQLDSTKEQDKYKEMIEHLFQIER
jgi:glutamyl-tRNA reductase